MNRLPLENIKVIEFSHMVMGPSAGMILADLGAEVIKVEPIGGDKTRKLKGSGAGYFAMYNRNKKSVCIDMKSAQGHEIISDLVKDADVVIENFRPGALDDLGYGYESLSEINDRLIYMSARGFLKGPYQNRTALDEVAQMMGGLAYMTGPQNRPLRAGASVVDVMGGMFGVIGILSGLLQRNTSDKGERITSSLFESTVFLMGQHMAQHVVTGQPAAPMPERISAWAIYDVFEIKNKDKLFVAVVSDSQWVKFCLEFGFDDFAKDANMNTNVQRVVQRDLIVEKVAEHFKQIELSELTTRLKSIGLPYAPINRPQDLPHDPHLLESGGLLDIEVGEGKQAQLPALPLEFSEERLGVRRNIPEIGEHTKDVLQSLGYSDQKVGELLIDKIAG